MSKNRAQGIQGGHWSSVALSVISANPPMKTMKRKGDQKMQRILRIGIVLLGICAMAAVTLPGRAVAQMSSDSYRISRSVLSGGGSPMASSSYGTNFTLGQSSPLGSSSSDNFSLFSGFWNIVLHAIPLRDVNGDGVVDLTDVILVLQVLVGFETGDVNLAADANGDGVIGAADVIYILQYVSELR
jgi:Dockerin type I domain